MKFMKHFATHKIAKSNRVHCMSKWNSFDYTLYTQDQLHDISDHH